MDPTETLIELLDNLQELEDAFAKDKESDETAELRTEVIGQLKALQDWLGDLNGFPPKISEIEL